MELPNKGGCQLSLAIATPLFGGGGMTSPEWQGDEPPCLALYMLFSPSAEEFFCTANSFENTLVTGQLVGQCFGGEDMHAKQTHLLRDCNVGHLVDLEAALTQSKKQTYSKPSNPRF